MKKRLLSIMLTVIMGATLLVGCGGNSSKGSAAEAEPGELKGEITFWHSFTQGARLETIQAVADQFMKDNPDVKINIETFSWGDFYTKWTTGLASGNVPDMSTALPGHVVEMMDAEAIIPVDDVIDNIGRDKFSKSALSEGESVGSHYSLPLYSHAQVMWYRKDLLEAAGLEVPKTWKEFADAAKVLTTNDAYGCSFPTGSKDLMGTRFLNFYVRSAGGSLLTDDLKADLTSDLAIDGINYWLDIYKNSSPKDSVNYAVLDQATLFYQGKTAFDFNSGFQISGVATNSPDLVDKIDCAPIPKVNANDPDYGIETSNIPMVIWEKSEHPEICKAFIEKLYEKENYIKFLEATPVGMLPAIKGISDTEEYKSNETVKKFSNAVDVISTAVDKGTAIGFEHGPSVEAGLLTSQGIIESMFQDIITNGTDVKKAAQTAEDKLNELFSTVK
ncbi:ABC transporter substrate-binding protein [Clostridium tertium]|uniref:ABC transporter substrate-binding protein n=1 Tax=Clostridium tertium TaxID=1559 RepID=UPI0018ABA567|nr:sugar ABC transporter substrate-binding protein [Clostridium tertium]MDB1934410.1 extracellular solute-binding protein [Clostridium tertium]MDB1935911.1 extracellular solute-binding protein [Clostridium tertium]MDB1969705.1 extracellular solute-binding protein [Clostridium tertium]MDU1567771.1 extracellular solute-binding protein [Clostridium sp.]